MKLKVLRIVIQSLLIALYFFPIMHQKDDVTQMFNGFEAIINGNYLIIGNIVIAFVMLGTLFHWVVLMFELVLKDKAKEYEATTNMIVNMTVILGLVIVTFLGTFLELYGYLILVLLIVSTYLRYLSQKVNE